MQAGPDRRLGSFDAGSYRYVRLRQLSPCGPALPSSFHRTLDQLRSIAENESEKGALFERLMRKYFTEDPVYRDRFASVWLWAEWPAHYLGFDRADTGIDRYHIVQDRQSGIVNDPNTWFDKPEDLLATIQRVVHVSVETVRIVEGLPKLEASLNA